MPRSLPPLAELKPPLPLWGCRAAPAGWAGAAHHQAPSFDVPPGRLFRVWLVLAARQPRTELIAQDERALRSLHVQRTPRLRLPDLVRAEVVALGAERSGIVLDSRARYGLFDFGVNRRRVLEWLADLQAAVEV